MSDSADPVSNVIDIFKSPKFKWKRAPWYNDENLMCCEKCGNFHFISILQSNGAAKLRCISCYSDVSTMEMISIPNIQE